MSNPKTQNLKQLLNKPDHDEASTWRNLIEIEYLETVNNISGAAKKVKMPSLAFLQSIPRDIRGAILTILKASPPSSYQRGSGEVQLKTKEL